MAVVSTTTVNRTRITTTRTIGGDVVVDDDRPTVATTTSGDKYVSMDTILTAFRRVVDRDNVDQVSEENLAVEVQAMCPQWDCPKSSDAVLLVREYLREASLQGLCSETGTKGFWRLGKGPSDQARPAVQTNLCPEHRSALMDRGSRRINGMTKEQVFRLVCRILREDGQKYNDVYCLCNKCLGAKNGKVSRCRLPPNSKKSKHGQKNMQLLKNHRKLTEKMKAERSSNKKSKKSRSKSAKSKSARSQERKKSAGKVDAPKSKSKKSSKSKSSSKKSGSNGKKKNASKKSKSKSKSKKNKKAKRAGGPGDEEAEADAASRSKNKRGSSKRSSKKSRRSAKDQPRQKNRRSKKARA